MIVLHFQFGSMNRYFIYFDVLINLLLVKVGVYLFYILYRYIQIRYLIVANEQERGKLSTICHWQKLKEWDLSEEVEGVQTRVKASGLASLIDHNYRCIDCIAMSTFVE